MSTLAEELGHPPPPRAVQVITALVGLAGFGVWLFLLYYGDAPRAWRAMLTNFIFFTPMTAGLVVWSAVVIVSQGRWAEPIKDRALAGVSFAPVSLVAFFVLWLGRGQWARWLWAGHPHQGSWLASSFVFARDGAALLVLWSLIIWFSRRRWGGRPTVMGGILIVVYCLVLTLQAFDLVMALDPHWYSTLFGGYYFISGMYAAVAAWAVLVALQRPWQIDELHDLGKLIVAFSLLTTYMMFSQLLPIWYENLPAEARFVLPRLTITGWPRISLLLLVVVYLGPLVLLLPRRAKRSPRYLGLVAATVLAGLWLERWWLVAPTLDAPPVLGLTEASITVAFLAAFAVGVGLFERLPTPAPPAAMKTGIS